MASRIFSLDACSFSFRRVLVASACASGLMLAACGGGGGSSTASTPLGDGTVEAAGVIKAASTTTVTKPATRSQAARFLTQATFGPTEAEINRVMEIGYQPWINEQMAMPMATRSHLAFWQQRNNAFLSAGSPKRANSFDVTNSFWRQALTEPDQLRQRVAFALSQIFVLSMADGCGADQSQGVAGYLDMLGKKAFGSYRELLESVALHPVMGCYLSHLKNQKEDLTTGRVPDENFAREIMQLFSIGLYELNMDGTLKKDAAGKPIDTYGPNDVAGLAKVFTGFGWDCPGWPSDRCFRTGLRDGDYAKSPEQFTALMRPYPQFHSGAEKRFLKTVIPAQSSPDPAGSLKVALDALAAHPNVAPFIGKQMIQRLVTSNPSPAYVARVANTFKASGLNLGTLVRAVLTDPEAMTLAGPSGGKVREPVLRFTALLRAYGAKSNSGDFIIGPTDNQATRLGQSPLMSPSVFNFFRPGYTPPGSNTSAAGLVAPEMQLLHESSAAGYVNYMRDVIWAGVGLRGYDNAAPKLDVYLEFNTAGSPTLLLADNPGELVESINQKLMYGTMPASLKLDIVTAISSIDFRSKTSPTTEQIFNTRQRRVWSALLLTVASPEYQVQL